MSNWYNENSVIDYPFVTNKNVNTLPKSEIVDCRFFLSNPQTENIKVFLHEYTNNNGAVTYVFRAKDGTSTKDLTFTATKTADWQCVWNTTDSSFYGFIVITGTGVS